MAASPITRAKLAARAGCHLETIRYYENTGLMPPPPRAANGYRHYTPALEQRLRFILRARDLGFSMADVRSLLDLAARDVTCCGEVKARAERHLAQTRQRIADLERIASILHETSARCAGGVAPDCPILDLIDGDGEAKKTCGVAAMRSARRI